MRVRHFLIPILLASLSTFGAKAQAPASRGINSINEADLKEWLTYSLRRAPGARHLHRRPRPRGRLHLHLAAVGRQTRRGRRHLPADRQGAGRPHEQQRLGHGGRERPVAHVQGRRRASRSHGRWAASRPIDGATIAFVGYGLQIPAAEHRRLRRRTPKGKVVVYLGPQGPSTCRQDSFRLLSARGAQRGREGSGRGDRQCRHSAVAAGVAPAPQPSAPAPRRARPSRRRTRRPAVARRSSTTATSRPSQRYDNAGHAAAHRPRTSSSSSSSADRT